MKTLRYVLGTLLLLGIAVGAYASTIPNTPNLFETYLANSQGSSDTTLTIASASLRDGSTLSGYVCLTVDANTPSLEFECGTLSGTTMTVSLRGIDASTGITGIASLQYAHHRGADVKISDYPTLTQISRIFQNNDTIPNVISYIPSLATTTIAASRSNVVSVGLLDDTAFNGASVVAATTLAPGVSQLATQIQTASSTATTGNGYSLVIPASNATSTYNPNTAALRAVVTQNNGYIDPGFTNPYYRMNRQVFSSPGTTTFTVPATSTEFMVQVIGGGGAGGGTTACTGAERAGSGGSGGGYANKIVNLTGTSTVQVFVGNGGAGVSANTGNPGLWSTFGTNGFFESASGGLPGAVGAVPGGVAGTGTGGDYNASSSPGGPGFNASVTTISAVSGVGGGSILGGGGVSVASADIDGVAGINGGGGSGSSCQNNGNTNTGGAGGNGMVIISW